MGTVVVLVTFAILGRIPLTVGVVGHEGSTVIVVMNRLRLLFCAVRPARRAVAIQCRLGTKAQRRKGAKTRRNAGVRILGFSELVVVVSHLAPCSPQIWGPIGGDSGGINGHWVWG